MIIGTGVWKMSKKYKLTVLGQYRKGVCSECVEFISVDTSTEVNHGVQSAVVKNALKDLDY